MDCGDSSDEVHCPMLALNTGYSNLMVPTGPSGTLNLTLKDSRPELTFLEKKIFHFINLQK